MGKKFGVLAAILFVAIMGAVMWVFPYGEGPLYNGKHLSAWLKELPGKGNDSPGIMWGPLFTNPSASELTAVDAVQHIGTNAIPFLMGEMRVKSRGELEAAGAYWNRLRDNFMRTWLHKPIAMGWSSGAAHKNAAELRHWDAARGLHALGPLAEPTIPELLKILNQPDTSPDAAYALSGMGANGFAALMQSLTNQYDWIGMCAIWAVGQTRTNTDAVAPFVGLLTNTNADLRMAASWSLGELRSQPELVAPALAENLGDTGVNVRSMAEGALAKYGIESVSARALTDYLKDPKLHVRMAATNGLRVLYPKEAANAGIR